MYMRQYAWRIIRISKEILQIFSHYFAESATRRRLPQAISKTCGDAPTRRRQKRLRKMEVGLGRNVPTTAIGSLNRRPSSSTLHLRQSLGTSTIQIKKAYLTFAFVAVTIFALLYGVSPTWYAATFLNITNLNPNVAH